MFKLDFDLLKKIKDAINPTYKVAVATGEIYNSYCGCQGYCGSGCSGSYCAQGCGSGCDSSVYGS